MQDEATELTGGLPKEAALRSASWDIQLISYHSQAEGRESKVLSKADKSCDCDKEQHAG